MVSAIKGKLGGVNIFLACCQKNINKKTFCVIIATVVKQKYIGEMFKISTLTEEKNMNKTELIEAVAKSAGLSKKDAGVAVAAVFDEMTAALKKGDKVQMIGFGTFEVRERAARKARNPQTGEEISIKASKVPAFKAGKALKDAVK